jgi:hypothetical protein
MNAELQSLRRSLVDFFGSLGTQVQAAFAVGVIPEQDAKEAERYIDPDFEGWLHGDPMVTGNLSSRYGPQPSRTFTGPSQDQVAGD